jgi:serine/threonine protein kinase
MTDSPETIPPTERGPAQRLMELWRSGHRPDVSEFLTQVGPPDLDDLLAVLRVDQQQRWKSGECVSAETYLRAHPTLAADLDRAAALVHGEYLLRLERGEAVTLDEYAERFPVHARRLLELYGEIPTQAGVVQSPATIPPSSADLKSAGGFPGYKILRELGRGGMGVVHAARDDRTGQHVALKAMLYLDPALLVRFKQEFRHLANVKHPNLVTLYKLAAEGPVPFFTMELLEGGTGFSAHVRGGVADGQPLPAAQTDRLRDAFSQLADGLNALHAAGVIHRDLKPGNVLVTPEGRVVILDFGLAAEIDDGGQHQITQQRLMGTVGYMAPEQAACQAVSPASDWYAVGVMLFEALTGRLPFVGPQTLVLQAKQEMNAPDPRSLVPDLPADLADLCVALLARDPAVRPGGADVRRWIGERSCPLTPPPIPEVRLVGRHDHLSVLSGAFRRSRDGRPVVVAVQGQSGSGKSALLRRFIDELDGQGNVVILSGRCYEQESVPYKALDSLIDALSQFLDDWQPAQVEAVLPRDVAALARVFPVLAPLEAHARGPRRLAEQAEPQELRRRALAALREMLARLSDRRLLVLAIDDLQWGDEDSIAVLAELLAPPDPPVLLLVCAYRSEDAEVSPCLRAFRRLGGPDRACEWVDLPVLPLNEAERAELARALLAGAAPAAQAAVEQIARQSGGLPVFVHELARHLRAGEDLRADALNLSEVLWSRVKRLEPAARRLLEVVAVASRPIGLAEACIAALVHDESAEALSLLRAERLLRGSTLAQGEQVETYHDRIRETVVQHLNAGEQRTHHRRLADVLEATGADPEWRAVHFLGAGEVARAGTLFAQAADRAAEALAFDRAARLYRQALTYRAAPGEQETRRLRTRLGESLALAGHAATAAAEFQAVALGAEPAQALDLRRRSALLLLSSGHVDEGMAALRDVVTSVGLSLCRSPRTSFWSLVWQRILLRLRGLKYTQRRAEDVPADLLAKLDVCDTAAAGLAMVDTIHGAYFQSRSLRLALQAGESRRLVRALALEGGHESIVGTRGPARGKLLLATADDLAKRTGDAYSRGIVLACRGVAAALAGEWDDAVKLCDSAEEVLRDCPGVTWELGLAHRFGLWPLVYRGEMNEVARRLPMLVKLARERDDLFEETNLCLVVRTFLRLANDESQRAREELAALMGRWSQQGFHVQHMNRLFDDVQIDLYQGDVEVAHDRLKQGWGQIERSKLLQVQQVRIFLTHLRARTALALATKRPAESLLLEASRDARSLAGENAPWAAALAKLIEAGVAARRNGPAADVLAQAANLCDSASMGLYAASGRWLRGRLIGGTEGRRLTDLADAWMAAQRVVKRDRMAMLLVPGILTEPLPGDPSCLP